MVTVHGIMITEAFLCGTLGKHVRRQIKSAIQLDISVQGTVEHLDFIDIFCNYCTIFNTSFNVNSNTE